MYVIVFFYILPSGHKRSEYAVLMSMRPGHVAQSVGHLTLKSEVLGSIPDLATYFRFSFR